MTAMRFVAAATLVAGLLGGCGGSDASTTTMTTAETTTTPSSTSSTSSTTQAPTLEQPAVWPAPGVVFDSPGAAAASFVSEVFGVPPNLGEFQQGDARSGEIEVYSPAEGGGTAIRSLLLLRQLGPANGWHVIAAVSDSNTITSPGSGAEVTAGPVEVSGEGRGFEGALVIEAFAAGEPTRLDQQLAQGGSGEATGVYSVKLDLSTASPGETVFIVVRGGVGLETDTGEFSAIPLRISR